MKKVILISCVRSKLSRPSKARDLYVSPLFKKNMAYAVSIEHDVIYILSAKYGLVGLDDEIEPYDLTLNNMTRPEIQAWAKKVKFQLERKTDLTEDHFIFLAGANYRKYLVPYIRSYEVPLEGLTFGRQLQRLSELSRVK